MEHCADAGIDSNAQAIDRGPGRDVPRELMRIFQEIDLACGIAGPAKTREPGLAREIESAGLDRLGAAVEALP